MEFRQLPIERLHQAQSEHELFKILSDAFSINGRIMSLGRLAQRAAALYGSRTALICRDRSIDFQQIYQQSLRVGSLLRTHGVGAGDRVLLWWENSIEFYIGYFAIVQLGAVVAPLNVFLQESEMRHIVADCQPRVMLISNDLKAKIQVPLDQLPPIISTAEIDAYQEPFEPYEPVDRDPDDLVALLYTSGTTGFPKGVMISSRNIMTNVAQGVARIGLGLEEHERLLGILPLFHSFAQFACVWSPFLMGACVIVVPRIERRYLLEGVKQQPTIFLGVPALYGLLALLKTVPLDSVKYFVSGGDALPDKIRSVFELLYRRKICTGYGLTETSPLVAAYLEDEAARTNTVGRLVEGMKARIVGDNDQEVARGQIGELLVAGDNVMLGYYNAPEATAQVLSNGWFRTGDLVYMDDENRLVITGRAKDLIANKGFKIYPQEIENVLMGHPLVLRVAVIGMPDPAGQVPVAHVQVREMTPGIATELKELCMRLLAPYKIPRSFICSVDPLPTTATGKVDKKALIKK